jgi:hypothetical protein
MSLQMQMPNSNLMRSFVVALVLATTVAASAAISGRETATDLADSGLITAQGKTPVIDQAGFMQIAVETLQIAGQLSGYADPPKHLIHRGKQPAIALTP